MRNITFTSNEVDFSSTCGVVWNDSTAESVIYMDAMRLEISQCTFKYNEAPRGSAIYWTGGALVISNSVFDGNLSTSNSAGFGGAIYFINSLDTRFSDVIEG